jgi:exonuclease SbcC
VIPVELDLHNFLAYRDPGPLSFEGIHVACLAGPNGAGKSSLLDAMTWALWGKARSNSADELIHQGENEMQVTLTFEQSSQRYRVIRQRNAGKRGSSLLEFQAWDPQRGTWQGISEATIRETQAAIDSLLRLEYDTFVNSAFLLQGKADEFTTKTPGQRKQVLANILGLSIWEDFEERAKNCISDTREQLGRIDGWLEEIQRELERRESYTQEVAEAEKAAADASERLEQAEKEWANLEQIRNELILAQKQVDDLTRRIVAKEKEIKEAQRDLQQAETQADTTAIEAALAQVREELSEIKGQREEYEQLQGQREELAQKSANLNGVNQTLAPEAEPIKERAATLEKTTEPTCPTCGQPLSEEHREKLLRELRQEIEDRRALYRENRERIQAIQAKLSGLEPRISELKSQLGRQPDLEKKAGELERAHQHAGESGERAKALREKISRWQADLEMDRATRSGLEASAETSEQTLRSASISQADLDRLRLEKRLADERVGGARQKLAALETFERQREERLKRREELSVDLGQFEDLREAFSKRGVPAMIIETAVPEVEHSANELLTRMTDGRLNVRIETQRETKAGDLREALDIIISDELGSRPYELYSGGEAFRINFAIRIALSKLLARRAGAQLRSLFIDEGFGTQDARGREHLVSAINSIQDDFDRILVITHIEELKDAFPTRIEVTKTPQGSRFSLS